MTTMLSAVSPDRRFALWAATLIATTILSSFAFACAVPLAGFAAVAALTASRRDALLLTGAVWLTNQALGFLFMHYPTDAMTLFWGGALGVIALLSCESAGVLARRFHGFAGGLAAFLASFVVYESLVLAVTAATGPGVDHFTAPVVSRTLFVNLGAFVALLMLKAAGAAAASRDLSKTLASRLT
ncbi:hypothetical protein [Methylocystis sp. B8]|uniref:hypothetical protein n=1 Tax=Methylocystis sp. B8 TaxID=544938 RepID=UPI0010FF53FA|nr:hypothetical protein [Methylocystis sp. B8]TLG76822.1 hypothetical protein FEV16_08735 [Methylocystis sp. B8]